MFLVGFSDPIYVGENAMVSFRVEYQRDSTQTPTGKYLKHSVTVLI
jgi:hypothetical protein